VQVVYLIAWENGNIDLIWFKMLAGTNAFCMKVLMIMLVRMFGTDFTIENQFFMDGQIVIRGVDFNNKVLFQVMMG